MILSDLVTNPKTINRFRTLEEDCLAVHKNRYTYDNYVYVDNRTKSYITCSVHGDFLQSVGKHITAKRGCPKCNKGVPITTDEFISLIDAPHKSTTDYSEVNYISAKQKVQFTCTKHDIKYQQTPDGHKKSPGCSVCRAEKQRSNTNWFIAKASDVHNGFYLYDKSVYTHSREKLIIACPRHGEFMQYPSSHLAGHGCEMCRRDLAANNAITIYERFNETPTTFYIIEFKGLYKIGITTRGTLERYKYEVDDLNELKVLQEKTFNSYKEAHDYESSIKDLHKTHRYYGKKIFKLTGNSEIFKKTILQHIL